MRARWAIASLVAVGISVVTWSAEGETPEGRYLLQESTVLDQGTNLMWTRHFDGIFAWEQALAYCQNLDLAGHQDWRLPSYKELATLVDLERGAPKIDTDAFPGLTSQHTLWTSTPRSSNPMYSYTVPLDRGMTGTAINRQELNVLCVRTP